MITPSAATGDDRFGIQHDYVGNSGEPARLSPRTVRALRAAIGSPDTDTAPAPLVTRPGAHLALGEPASGASFGVLLEDGQEVGLDPAQPVTLPLGYHRLHTDAGERTLIVSPGSCILPDRRAWGWTAQLYATRSWRSWGIGDLGDLATLTRLARSQGAGFVLINPLHAGGSAVADGPQQASPYFPSTRRFLDPLYLSVADVDGAQLLDADLDRYATAGRALSEEPRIDRDAAWRLKRAALREVFDRTGAAGSAGLADWRRARGPAIEQFAAWSVLTQRHGPSWRAWPDDVRRPDGSGVRELNTSAGEDLAFVAWLQWQLELQLRAAGTPLPVLQDLPVGVGPDGADAWAYQDVLADGATVGAPPDPFNLAGQDWGLPPFVPWRLRAAQYEPFIDCVRATIALAGGLRIDHVMGLFRLWWVPAGLDAAEGGYVRYPAADLLDIVALESHRAGAPVVGEDLGTVEPGVREDLTSRNVLSYRLLWFEADPPGRWPTSALAAVGTHDLPTVAGLWSGADLADQRAAGVEADEQATVRLRRLLTDDAGVPDSADAGTAVDGAYRLLARAPSLLLAASLDDAVAHTTRPNLPGTVNDRNWSTPLPLVLEDLPDHPGVRHLAEILGDAVGDR